LGESLVIGQRIRNRDDGVLTSTGKDAMIPKCSNSKVWETNRRACVIFKKNNDLSKDGPGGMENKGNRQNRTSKGIPKALESI